MAGYLEVLGPADPDAGVALPVAQRVQQQPVVVTYAVGRVSAQH